MSIVSSQIVEDRAQADGRRAIRERHTDHIGRHQEVTYLAESGANATTTMNNRVAQIEAHSKATEILANLNNALSDDTPAPTFDYSTQQEFSSALRELFKLSRGRDALRLGWYVESFNLTNNQLANLFGITAGQATTLQTKLDNMAAAYEAMLAEVGQ